MLTIRYEIKGKIKQLLKVFLSSTSKNSMTGVPCFCEVHGKPLHLRKAYISICFLLTARNPKRIFPFTKKISKIPFS